MVLAGGSGTRLHPVTRAISKQILPIYDKPMVYYPISALMLADAFIVGRSFLGDLSVSLVLGDNIFYGQGFQPLLHRAAQRPKRATIFAYPVTSSTLAAASCSSRSSRKVSLGSIPGRTIRSCKPAILPRRSKQGRD